MDLDCKELERLKELVPYKILAPTPNEIINYIEQLQSNWNSLRECIIGVIEGAKEELNTIIHTTDISTEDGLEYVNQCSREFDVIRKNLEIALDKMNELEGKDKE
jgi:hypothetical protein